MKTAEYIVHISSLSLHVILSTVISLHMSQAFQVDLNMYSLTI